MKNFSIIVAIDAAGGIGRNGQLPWRLPGELKHFRQVTTGEGNNAVIMGMATWQSLPAKFRPLPARKNIVLSRHQNTLAGAAVAASLDQALDLAATTTAVFVIGGASVYRTALEHPGCAEILVTRINGTHSCDVFFPPIPESFFRVSVSDPTSEAGETYCYERYVRN